MRTGFIFSENCKRKDSPFSPLSNFWIACLNEGFPDSSVGKESAYNAGDPSSIPGSGRSTGEGDRLPTPVFLGFPGGSADKESA